jgi:hypothetical protein
MLLFRSTLHINDEDVWSWRWLSTEQSVFKKTLWQRDLYTF